MKNILISFFCLFSIKAFSTSMDEMAARMEEYRQLKKTKTTITRREIRSSIVASNRHNPNIVTTNPEGSQHASVPGFYCPKNGKPCYQVARKLNFMSEPVGGHVVRGRGAWIYCSNDGRIRLMAETTKAKYQRQAGDSACRKRGWGNYTHSE